MSTAPEYIPSRHYPVNGVYAEGQSLQDQEVVREALREWADTFPNYTAAAAYLGISIDLLERYRNRRCRIPNWIVESLGFRHAYIQTEPKEGFVIPGKTYYNHELVYIAPRQECLVVQSKERKPIATTKPKNSNKSSKGAGSCASPLNTNALTGEIERGIYSRRNETY